MKLVRNLLFVLVALAILCVIGMLMARSGEKRGSSDPDLDLVSMKRVIAENALISMEIKCLPEPLTKNQKQYLIDARSEYISQHYVEALITDANCLNRAVRRCEGTFPGQCVAVSGERGGEVPH